MNKQIEEIDYNSSSIKRNSVLVALLIGYNLINTTLDMLLPISQGIGNIVAGIIVILFITTFILNKSSRVNILSIGIISYILIFILLSFIILSYYEKTIEIFINFLFFGIISYLIGTKKINTELIFRYTTYISLISILVFDKLINSHSIISNYERIDMGLSYAILPMVFSSLLHFLYYRNQANVLIWLGYFFNIYNFYLLVTLGTRGSLVSILLFIWLLLLNRYIKKNRESKLIHSNKWMVLAIIFSSSILLYFNKILKLVDDFLNEIGIQVAFIEKNTSLIENSGDITNDRMGLFDLAFQGIKDSPIWGNGIGSFNYNTGYSYPHNFILDLLYEGGLFLTIPIILILIIGILKVILGKSKDKDMYLFLVLLICSCIPRLMFSASIWKNQLFWMLLGYLIVNFNSFYPFFKVKRN